MKVLVPTDFSTTARNAIGYAIRMVRQFGGEVLIFHANDPASGRMDEDIRKEFDFLDKDLKSRITGKLKISFIHDNGKLKDILQSSADKTKADLILMGTNRATGKGAFKIGSNAYAVIENSPTPVLVVPPGADFYGISKLVMALDIKTEFKDFPLVSFLKLLKWLKGDLYILSVFNNAVDNRPKAIMDVRKISSVLKNVPHSFHYFYNDNIEKSINDFLRIALCRYGDCFPSKTHMGK